jgi:hypothetical protein
MSPASAVPSFRRSVFLITILASSLAGALRAQAIPDSATNHKGVFFTLGLGYGSVGCDGCDSGA